MLRKFIYLLLITLSPFWVKSQLLKGKIVDKETHEPIGGVNVVDENSRLGVSTNKEGVFQIQIKSFPIKLKCTHVAYKPFVKNYDASEISELNFSILVELEFDSIMLEGAEISSERIPEIIFRNKVRHVSDFDFIGDQLFILAYQRKDDFKSQKDYGIDLYQDVVLYYSDTNNVIIDSLILQDGRYDLRKSYSNLPIIESKKEFISIDVVNQKLDSVLIAKDVFSEYFEPFVDSIGPISYVSNFNPTFPAFEYYTLDTRDSSHALLRYVCDDFGMEMMRSEFKYLSNRDRVEANNMALRTGIDRKIIGAYMRGFNNKSYFETLYAPLFVLNDTVLIFDHYKDRLIKYSKWNNAIDSVSFNFHKKKRYDEKLVPNRSWDGEIYFDQNKENLWTSYSRNGRTYLKQINIENGLVSKPIQLYYRYVERVRVKDDYVYYTYRPFESSQKKYLYREKLIY